MMKWSDGARGDAMRGQYRNCRKGSIRSIEVSRK